MRICIPIHSFEPGGVERVALRLAEAWQHSGASVTIVLGRAQGITRDQAPALRYVTRPEPLPTARWETLWLIWSLWRYLRRNPADVIFCAGNTYAVVCVAMKLLLGRRCPPVLAKISNALDRRDMRQPTRMAYALWVRLQGRVLDRFVATAPPMAAEAATALGIALAGIEMIANPILKSGQYAQAITAHPGRAGGRTFIAVGRLEAQKNYPLMLQAFARMARPSDRLRIAGAGGERGRIERTISRLKLDDQVELLGHVVDVAPLLQSAHALVLSSDYEGLPGAVVEALAAGVSIAATDCCASMRWLLGDGRFGVLAHPRDCAGLAAAMEAAIGLPPEGQTMRAFASQFTIEQAAPRYLASFEALRAAGLPVCVHGPRDCVGTARDRNAAL